ncbi:transcriptional activator of glycolytic enzymes-domain-containing protein [Xylariaceae sp. FL0255]|nr:transcriptional activator of glycolytic enzymes-domain-containing protein [Xylariaceae sp. FL0255]
MLPLPQQITNTTHTHNTLPSAAAAAASTPAAPISIPIPISVPIPILSSSSSATATNSSTVTPAAPGPAARTGASTLKRPAASDLQRIAGTTSTPSKRQATGSGNLSAGSVPSPSLLSSISPTIAAARTQLILQPFPAMMPASAPITKDQLQHRTTDELIGTILDLQAQHQQVIAQINAQYENINQQLNELRGSLVASHQAAATALSTRDQPPRSIIPPPPVPIQQTAIPPPPRPPIQTPTRVTPRIPPASPSHQTVPQSALSVSTPTSGGPPAYDYRTVGTVEEVWREYRTGMDGQPAVEQLDAQWGSRWRPEPRGRTWYSRRKVIWDKIKEFMAEGMDENEAVREVEKLREGGTINKLIRLLQEERKDKPEDGMVG